MAVWWVLAKHGNNRGGEWLLARHGDSPGGGWVLAKHGDSHGGGRLLTKHGDSQWQFGGCWLSMETVVVVSGC